MASTVAKSTTVTGAPRAGARPEALPAVPSGGQATIVRRKGKAATIRYQRSRGVDAYVRAVADATPMEIVEIERQGVLGAFIKDLSKRMEVPTSRIFTILGVPKAKGAFVTEEALQVGDVHPEREQTRRNRVPQQVRVHALGDAGRTGHAAHDLAHALAGHYMRQRTGAALPGWRTRGRRGGCRCAAEAVQLMPTGRLRRRNTAANTGKILIDQR